MRIEDPSNVLREVTRGSKRFTVDVFFRENDPVPPPLQIQHGSRLASVVLTLVNIWLAKNERPAQLENLSREDMVDAVVDLWNSGRLLLDIRFEKD